MPLISHFSMVAPMAGAYISLAATRGPTPLRCGLGVRPSAVSDGALTVSGSTRVQVVKQSWHRSYFRGPELLLVDTGSFIGNRDPGQ